MPIPDPAATGDNQTDAARGMSGAVLAVEAGLTPPESRPQDRVPSDDACPNLPARAALLADTTVTGRPAVLTPNPAATGDDQTGPARGIIGMGAAVLAVVGADPA